MTESRSTDWRSNVRFVLVEPHEQGNIGASARAIKNMGFSSLALVNPPERITDEAGWFARNATDVLRDAPRLSSLNEAISDCVLVVGMSRRKGKKRGVNISVEEAALRIIEAAAQGPAAVLFGRENKGLYNDETERCGFLVAIPAGNEHPSLNLSHAVQIMAYEVHKASGPQSKQAEPLATVAEMEHIYGIMKEMLEELEFSKRGDRELGRKIYLGLRRFYGRTGLFRRELHMFEGIYARILGRLRERRLMEGKEE